MRLLQVRAVRASDRSHTSSRGTVNPEGGKSPGPPAWTPYDGSALCACCSFPFTWHSTFKGEAQEYRERYNCRHCGGLICGPCSTKRRAIPRLGLMQPSRVCDKCFYKVIENLLPFSTYLLNYTTTIPNMMLLCFCRVTTRTSKDARLVCSPCSKLTEQMGKITLINYRLCWTIDVLL
jgi:hypothetical protein